MLYVEKFMQLPSGNRARPKMKINQPRFKHFAVFFLLSCISVQTYAAMQSWTEEEVTPNIHLSKFGEAHVQTKSDDPVVISAEIDVTDSVRHTLSVSYSVKPNKGNKLVNVYVKLQSDVPDRPAENGTVWDSYGLDKETSDGVEGTLNDTKFSSAATTGMATVIVGVSYVDANGGLKEFSVPAFKKPFTW